MTCPLCHGLGRIQIADQVSGEVLRMECPLCCMTHVNGDNLRVLTRNIDGHASYDYVTDVTLEEVLDAE